MKIKLNNGITITGDNLVVEIDDSIVKIIIESDKGIQLNGQKQNNITPFGIYIVLEDGTYISKKEYDQDKHEAKGILIHTENLCHELDLFDHPEPMPWDEAVKHSIPSKEQWEEISNHREEIEEIIKLTGGDTLKGKWYWTSTEFSSYTSWLYYGFNGYLSNLIKFYSFRVRPFAAFSL